VQGHELKKVALGRRYMETTTVRTHGKEKAGAIRRERKKNGGRGEREQKKQAKNLRKKKKGKITHTPGGKEKIREINELSRHANGKRRKQGQVSSMIDEKRGSGM